MPVVTKGRDFVMPRGRPNLARADISGLRFGVREGKTVGTDCAAAAPTLRGGADGSGMLFCEPDDKRADADGAAADGAAASPFEGAEVLAASRVGGPKTGSARGLPPPRPFADIIRADFFEILLRFSEILLRDGPCSRFIGTPAFTFPSPPSFSSVAAADFSISSKTRSCCLCNALARATSRCVCWFWSRAGSPFCDSREAGARHA